MKYSSYLQRIMQSVTREKGDPKIITNLWWKEICKHPKQHAVYFSLLRRYAEKVGVHDMCMLSISAGLRQ